MKHLKKALAVLLCICVALTCSGCGLVKVVEKVLVKDAVISKAPEVSAASSLTATPTPKPMGKSTPKPTWTPPTTSTPDPEEDVFYFMISSGGYAFLLEYSGPGGDVTIPGEYEGYAVESIYEEAFLDRKTVTSVTIPDSVTFIRERVFSGCTALKRVKLPKYLFSVEDEVFYETGLEELNLPDSVTGIGSSAFEGCKELREVVIPGKTLHILDRAFARCEKLEKVVIPPSVTRIDADAFAGCPKLTIYGYTGSEAERYANANGIPFVSTGGEPTPAPTPKATPKPAATLDLPSGVVGRDVTLTSDWSNSITMYTDGSFSMTVNLYEGYGTVYGFYSYTGGGNYEFSIADRDFYGFIGDDVWIFWMTADGNTLYYSGEQIGMVEAGYHFQ